MEVISCQIPGPLVIRPKVYRDERGFFMESWNERRYREAGMASQFVQDNFSLSRKGTLRGLHFQNPAAQAKLVSVPEGEVFDVAVDIRVGSPTYSRWHGVNLSSDNHWQYYIPPGFAHGFQVLSETALFHYKCTEFYCPGTEAAIRWDDPEIGIRWPIIPPALSTRDAAAPLLREVAKERLFTWPAALKGC